ncbi:MAG: DUF2807 domain-containing protein [Proteobacteria bacterium]|nr:DUF2807 domain-containing protein [Pseudomonadota bacterium]
MPNVSGSGNERAEERTLAQFGLIVEGNVEVILIGGGKNVKVVGDDNLIGFIKTMVDGDSLRVYVDCDCIMMPSKPIVVIVPSTDLKYIEANDNARIDAASLITNNMEFELNDHTRLKMKNVNAKQLDIIASDDAKVEVSGSAEDCFVQTDDDVVFDARDLVIQNAEVSSAGDSDVSLKVMAKLQADLSDDAVLKLGREPREQKTQLDDSASILRQY